MLNDATGFDKIFIATGYTDLRRGIDGLASTIKYQFELDPFQKNILFLFCGKRTDRIKGLVWEGDGFLLLYKRLNVGGFSWPRTKEEAIVLILHRRFKQMKAFIIQEFIHKFLNDLLTTQSAQHFIKIAAKFYITIF